MKLLALPPVRRPVPLKRASVAVGFEQGRRFFGNSEPVLFRSGTEALAAALTMARLRRADLAEAEVIIPAYGCPDLVSACVQAGVRAQLVDVAGGAWGYDEQALRLAISSRTVAIVAVNLLGLGDGAAGLARIAADAKALLIQDSAQHLPRGIAAWPGDIMIFSFGRGKPLNMLGGGALISKRTTAAQLDVESADGDVLAPRLAAGLFNLVTSPVLYAWVSRLPRMRLGETRYKPPRGVARLPSKAWARLGPALEEYARSPSYDAARWTDAVGDWSRWGIVPLLAAGERSPGSALLRLPLLAHDRGMRDALVDALNREGVGASRMYARALNRIEGVPSDIAAQGPFPNAEDLGDRLFTLPTHTQVTPRIVRAACAAVSNLLG